MSGFMAEWFDMRHDTLARSNLRIGTLSGSPESKQLADTSNGFVHVVGRDTILAKFGWIGRPPAEEILAALLDVAVDATGKPA